MPRSSIFERHQTLTYRIITIIGPDARMEQTGNKLYTRALYRLRDSNNVLLDEQVIEHIEHFVDGVEFAKKGTITPTRRNQARTMKTRLREDPTLSDTVQTPTEQTTAETVNGTENEESDIREGNLERMRAVNKARGTKNLPNDAQTENDT